MNKYIIILLLTTVVTLNGYTQANISPAPKQTKLIAITGATIHIGNGSVVENGTVLLAEEKLSQSLPADKRHKTMLL